MTDKKTITELFTDVKKQGGLPVGILTLAEGSSASEPDWVSEVNPSGEQTVKLPMKVVCIIKNNYKE